MKSPASSFDKDNEITLLQRILAELRRKDRGDLEPIRKQVAES